MGMKLRDASFIKEQLGSGLFGRLRRVSLETKKGMKDFFFTKE
jgi:hypothetical protein